MESASSLVNPISVFWKRGTWGGEMDTLLVSTPSYAKQVEMWVNVLFFFA